MARIKVKFSWKKLWNFLYGLVLIVLIVVALAVALSALNIPGGIKLYTVQSGSMSSTIPTGSLVISKPFNEYVKGDVITFKAAKDITVKNPQNTTTHRIYEVTAKDGKEKYVTKGDANNAPDSEPTSKELILGKAMFSIPLLGFPVSFAKTREGLIILVIIPATMIIYSELLNIKNETKKLLKERRERRLSLVEKVEVEIGEEEIIVERWYKRLLRKLHLIKPVNKTKKGRKKKK